LEKFRRKSKTLSWGGGGVVACKPTKKKKKDRKRYGKVGEALAGLVKGGLNKPTTRTAPIKIHRVPLKRKKPPKSHGITEASARESPEGATARTEHGQITHIHKRASTEK